MLKPKRLRPAGELCVLRALIRSHFTAEIAGRGNPISWVGAWLAAGSGYCLAISMTVGVLIRRLQAVLAGARP
jgi:hypothetical protein